MMYAFLQSVGWAYPIAPKLTTIGQSGCDIIINNPSIDQQHAVIERSGVDGSVYIRDLCTKNGTFVNNLPVRNTEIKLKTGDQLRFGCEPTVYEFQLAHEVDQHTLAKRTQTLTIRVPHWTNTNVDLREIKREAVLKEKPDTTGVSAEHSACRLSEQSNAVTQMTGERLTQVTPTQSESSFKEKSPSSIPNKDNRTYTVNDESANKQPLQCDNKDSLINRLREEITRLAPLEAVNAQKDVLIRNIQQQMNQLMSHRQCPNATSLTTQADARFNAGPLIGGSDMNLDHLERFKRNSLASPSRTRPVSASSLLRARQIHDVSNLTVTHQSSDFAPDEPINTALFERIRRERQILSGLVTQLQRDLANKDNDLGRLTQEVNALKKQLNEKDIALSASHIRVLKAQDTTCLQKEREEHEKEIATIRQKYKTAELRSQSLKEEAEKSERERAAMQKSLEESQNQLQAIRNSMNLLKSQYDELQRSERTAQLEKEEVTSQYERLRNKIMRTVFAALAKQCATSSNEIENNDGMETDNANESFVSVNEIGNTSNNAVDNEMDDNSIMDKLNVLVQDYFKLHRSLTAFTKTAKDQNQRDQSLEKELNEFVALMRENQNHISAIQHGRFSAQLRGQIDLLNAYAPKSKPIRLLQETLSQSWRGQLTNVQHIEDCIQEVSSAIASTCSDLTTSLTSHPHDTVTGIRRLAEFGMSMHAGREELQHELRQTRKGHEEEVQRIKQLHHKELQRRTEEAVNANNIENAEKLNQAISNVVRIENERQEQLIAVKQAIIEELEMKLRETRQLMAERQTSHEAELHLLRNRVRETDHLERALGDKQTAYVELSAQLESVKKAIEKTRQDTEATCEEKWRKEVELHREQAKQHARTICVMEERLVKLAKQTKEAKSEVTRLKRQQAELQTEHKQLQIRLGEAQQKLAIARRTPPPNGGEQQKQNQSTPDQIYKPGNISLVQPEVFALRGMLQERDATIAMLRADLEGVRAQLSDLRGELTEAQKEEIECAMDFGKKANAELASTRARLAQMNDMMSGLRNQLAEKESELRNQSVHLEELRSALEKHVKQSEQLSRLLDQERESHKLDLSQINNTSKLTEELAAVGGECRGERHLEIIAKQREALSQMRQRMREHPFLGDKSSSNEPNRQVANLRREVAELRSQTLLSEVLPALRATNTSRQPAIEGGSVRTETDSGLENTLIDRTGLRSAMDALHNSEECYLDLSRAIARQLDVDNLPGQRSLVHVPSPERQLIRQERAQALGLLSQRIGILREQVQRKTDLLNNYEHDMGKLRQAEAIAETKSEQMGRMLADLRSKETEIQLLRESLDRTREALANEQRTISAIKKSKRIIPSQSSMDSKGMADRKKQPHCPIADPISTDNKRIQDMCEKIKRKDYEIKMLKNELSEREKQYTETSEKLSRMQTSMGLEDS